jgi:hypothetical protein
VGVFDKVLNVLLAVVTDFRAESLLELLMALEVARGGRLAKPVCCKRRLSEYFSKRESAWVQA